MAEGALCDLRQLRWVHQRLAVPGPEPRLRLLSPSRHQATLPCQLLHGRPQDFLEVLPVRLLLCRPLQLRFSTAGGLLFCIMAASSVVDLISILLPRLHSCLPPAVLSPIQPPFPIESVLPVGPYGGLGAYVLAAPGS